MSEENIVNDIENVKHTTQTTRKPIYRGICEICKFRKPLQRGTKICKYCRETRADKEQMKMGRFQ